MNKFIAKLTSVATVASTVAMMAPAHAAPATDMADTLARLAVDETAVEHSLTIELPAGGVALGETLIISYDDAFDNVDAEGTGTASCDTGDDLIITDDTDDVITLTGDTTTCEGTLTLTGWFMDNPTTGDGVGSYNAYISGDAGVTGAFSIAIVDSDQVTVSATVVGYITFDIDTSVGTQSDELVSNDGATYTVNLGNITPDDTRVSGATDGVESIWLDLSTNAGGGASVTVISDNGTSGASQGLFSATSTDTITNTAGVVGDNTVQYGLCVADLDVNGNGAGGDFTDGSDFASDTATAGTGTCAQDGESNNVAAMDDTTPVEVLNSNGAPTNDATAEVLVQASIDNFIGTANDYQDVLTFIATGTF